MKPQMNADKRRLTKLVNLTAISIYLRSSVVKNLPYSA